MSPEFLTVEDVLEVHALQLACFGGADGLRDPGLLESAVAQPRATFAGDYVHEGVFAMAAAYLFHIVSNLADKEDVAAALARVASLEFLDRMGRNSRSFNEIAEIWMYGSAYTPIVPRSL